MKLNELHTNLLDEALTMDSTLVNSHAYWMAEVLVKLKSDPAYKKLGSGLREEIETIIAAVE